MDAIKIKKLHYITWNPLKVYHFAKEHGLHLNPTTSKLLLFGRENSVKTINEAEVQVQIDTTLVLIVKSAKNLGLQMDNFFRYIHH